MIKIIGIAAAIAGAVGTALLYKGTFGFEMLSGYSNNEIVTQMAKRNQRRLLFQRAGLTFLMLSFVLGGISVAITP
jgi:hypothetical protein